MKAIQRLKRAQLQSLSQSRLWGVSTYDALGLASLDCRSEDVRVLPVIIAELELGNIERHIFAAHFVECADDAALEDRPEAFDGLSVDCSDNILTSGVVNDAMRIFAVKSIVTGRLIRAKQADFMRDGFADKRGESVGIDIRDNASNDIALAADSADDWSFAGTDTPGSTPAAAFIPMPVFCQAADESFIDFDNSAELIDVLHKCDADAVTHIPSRFQGTKSHVTPDLARAYSLFAGEHQMNDAIPIAKRLIGILKNRAGEMRETIGAALSAIRAFPMPFTGLEIISPLASAARAPHAFRPALADKVSTASVFVREHSLKLGDAHLMDLRWLFCSRHNGLQFVEKTVS
jgi:hypothetical protein